MRKQIANFLTGSRLLCSIFLLFFPVFSVGFSALYLFCGFTDMVDGTVARKTNAASAFGAKLDTAADLAFLTAATVKILPVVSLPIWIWIWIGMIGWMKISGITAGIVSGKKEILPHTVMNKVTGLLLFLLPMTLPFSVFPYSSIIVCLTASFAALQEWFLRKK
ncbi:MAG: CDP-alcohol phosphatidyltransferase family protein [Oscillospiraceae bacterium]|nr:CDP-alcohol phosphatidyltransferase family protein [Oscillospiraceae bacterium]